jgi:hypothetical protein
MFLKGALKNNWWFSILALAGQTDENMIANAELHQL